MHLGCTLCHGTPEVVNYGPNPFNKGFSTTSRFVMEQTFLYWKPFYGMDLRVCFPSKPVKGRPYLTFFKRSFIFHKLFKGKEAVFTDLWNTVHHVFILMFVQGQLEMESGQGQPEIYQQPFDIFRIAPYMGCVFVQCNRWTTSSSDGLLYFSGILWSMYHSP